MGDRRRRLSCIWDAGNALYLRAMASEGIRYEPDVLRAGVAWDLTALDECLLAQMAANKPPLMRAMLILGRVDDWFTGLVNGRRR
jgi:hypothetical protein